MAEPKPVDWWRGLEERVRLWTPIVLSCSAIALTVYQASATRRHNRLSVTPRLDARLTYDDDTREVALSLANVGLGPALLKTLVLHHAGDALGPSGVDTCAQVSRRLGREGDGWTLRCFDPGQGYYMRPGDSVLVYSSREGPQDLAEPAAALPPEMYNISVTAEYCSFYDECWTYRSQ